MNFKNLITIVTVSAISSLGASGAIAQTYSNEGYPLPVITYPEMFHDVFFNYDGDIWEIADLKGQAETMFGFMNFRGSFPDNSIMRDGALVSAVWTEMMERQNTSDPVIRTPDLANPFNTSLRQNPSYIGNNPLTLDGQLVYDSQW